MLSVTLILCMHLGKACHKDRHKTLIRGPFFLSLWTFLPIRYVWECVLCGPLFPVDQKSVDLFSTCGRFFCGRFFPWTFLPYRP